MIKWLGSYNATYMVAIGFDKLVASEQTHQTRIRCKARAKV